MSNKKPRKLTVPEIHDFATEYANRMYDFVCDHLENATLAEGDMIGLKYEVTIQVAQNEVGKLRPFIHTVH